VLEIVSETDSAAASTLEDFLDWGTQQVQADHIMLVMWGHGDGEFLAFDQDSKHQMNVKVFGEVLNRFVEKHKKKIDLLATDSCLMQSIETLQQLSTSVDYSVGYFDLASRAGLPYRRILYHLNTSEHVSPLEIATKIPEFTNSSFRPEIGHSESIDPTGSSTLAISTVDLAPSTSFEKRFGIFQN
jgi:hypothetical protein